MHRNVLSVLSRPVVYSCPRSVVYESECVCVIDIYIGNHLNLSRKLVYITVKISLFI